MGRTFANCKDIMVSFLKARKVTVVGIWFDDAALEGLEGDSGRDIVQRRHFDVLEIVLSRKKDVFCSFKKKLLFASKMANCIFVEIVKYLMLLLANY